MFSRLIVWLKCRYELSQTNATITEVYTSVHDFGSGDLLKEDHLVLVHDGLVYCTSTFEHGKYKQGMRVKIENLQHGNGPLRAVKRVH